MAAKKPSNELHLTRTFDAPLELVWRVWTDPAHKAHWWGPRGFTITTHSSDIRTGGRWEYTMHGPDGTDYPNSTLFHEVEPLRKLVYDHGGYKDKPPLFRVTVLFGEQDGRTTMDLTMAFATPEAAKEAEAFIRKTGGNATWDRLAEYLGQNAGKNRFVINRSFAAPRKLVFEMWTNPDHFAKWLPPTGFDMTILKGEIRAGSGIFYRMSNDAGVTVYSRLDYVEIDKPLRIVALQGFRDENEGPGHHPLAPIWPAKKLSVIEFAEEGDDQTRVTVTWEPLECTAEELRAFLDERSGMTLGWTGSFDKLEALLASDGG